MKTYTLFLDIVILSLLVLAINFQLTDDYVTGSFTGRRGVIRMPVICWQTLLGFASFCVFMRYLVRNLR
jgi:hypothetical protein